MVFKLNLIDKQGKSLTASVKADTLEEAHQKAIAKGYSIEKNKDTDLVETIVFSKEEVAKARRATEPDDEILNNKIDSSEEELSTEMPKANRRTRGDRSNRDSTDSSSPSRSKNRRRPELKPNKSKSDNSTLFILLALSPSIWIVAWLSFPWQLIALSIQFPILILIAPLLVVVGFIFAVLILFRSIKEKKTNMIIFGSITTLINLGLLSFILYHSFAGK